MSQAGTAPITAPGWTAKPKDGVAIVDCDVHHNFRDPRQLLPHLSKFYQEHLLDQGLHLGTYANVPIRRVRTDLKGRIPKNDFAEEEFSGGDPAGFQFQAGVSARGTPRPLEYRCRCADWPPAILRIRRVA